MTRTRGLRRLLQLPFEVFCTAHGEPLKSGPTRCSTETLPGFLIWRDASMDVTAPPLDDDRCGNAQFFGILTSRAPAAEQT